MARILIVSDHPEIRSTLALRLESVNHEVEEAVHGAMGLEMIRGVAYDIILLDMQMPEMDGHVFILTLRQEGYQGVVVALIASGLISDAHRALNAGCSDYLLNPIGDDFEDRIAKLLSRRESH